MRKLEEVAEVSYGSILCFLACTDFVILDLMVVF